MRLSIQSHSLFTYVLGTSIFLAGMIGAGGIAKSLAKHFHNAEFIKCPALKRPDGDHFYVTTGGAELSHGVLFHEIGESIRFAREADVIFAGNSRLPMGLRGEVIVPLARKEGIKVYSLGVGHGEALEFSREIIKKHGLRPKIFVATGGPWVYEPVYSKMAEEAMNLSLWDAYKFHWEHTFAWETRSRLHRVIPRMGWNRPEDRFANICYRSTSHGWWNPVTEPPYRYDVGYHRSNESYDRAIQYAGELQAELGDQDTLLVATLVPFGATVDQHLQRMENELKIPVVYPKVDGLKTNDGSHLARESAIRYSQAFWEAFISHPAVVDRLSD